MTMYVSSMWLVWGTIIVAGMSAYSAQPIQRQTNIVFILADDLGWHDVGFHGSEINTPNIDRLAYGGVILNNYYVQPICTPTRASIMTGRYPIHTGMQHYVIAGSQPYGLPLEEKTLPQYLKDLGYKTHMVGKWHLGFFKKDYLPERRGFDSFYGYYMGHGDYFDHYSSDRYFGYDLHHNEETVWNKSEVYSTEMFTRQAEQIIHEHNQSKPLFLYLAHQAVHAGNRNDPIQAPQKYIERHPHIKDMKRRMFAGVVSALDDSVGAVYQALQDAGMSDNTLIVFSTDNGGPTDGYDGNAACNWPLRGMKNTLWQGGVRGVGFIHGPMIKRPGTVCDGLMHVVDWLPTLVEAAKGPGFEPLNETDAKTKIKDQDMQGLNAAGRSSDKVQGNLEVENSVDNNRSQNNNLGQGTKGDKVFDLSSLDGVSLWNELSGITPSTANIKDSYSYNNNPNSHNHNNISNWPRKEVLLNIDPIDKFGGIVVGEYKLVYGKIPYPGWYPPPGEHIDMRQTGRDMREILASVDGKDDKSVLFQSETVEKDVENHKNNEIMRSKKSFSNPTRVKSYTMQGNDNPETSIYNTYHSHGSNVNFLYENTLSKFRSYQGDYTTDLNNGSKFMSRDKDGRSDDSSYVNDATINDKTDDSNSIVYKTIENAENNVMTGVSLETSPNFSKHTTIDPQTSIRIPIEIKCGPVPPAAYTNCKPEVAPCLFRLHDDPCEFNNLAGDRPDIVASLQAKLAQYRHSMVPPRNKPQDPRGNPKYHGGVWVPWL